MSVADCLHCCKQFEAKRQYGREHAVSRFCSRSCFVTFPNHVKVCLRCSMSFCGVFRSKLCEVCVSVAKHVFTCQSCSKCFNHRKLDRKFCSVLCRDKWARGRLNVAPKSAEHRKKIGDAQRGVPKGPQSVAHRTKISQARRGIIFTSKTRLRQSEAAIRRLEKNKFAGTNIPFESSKTGEKCTAHSRLEESFMGRLDADDTVKFWTKNHRIRIKYEFDGLMRTYLPDFWIEYRSEIVKLVEAKGYEFDPLRCAAKAAAAIEYCRERGWEFEIVRE